MNKIYIFKHKNTIIHLSFFFHIYGFSLKIFLYYSNFSSSNLLYSGFFSLKSLISSPLNLINEIL